MIAIRKHSVHHRTSVREKLIDDLTREGILVLDARRLVNASIRSIDAADAACGIDSRISWTAPYDTYPSAYYSVILSRVYRVSWHWIKDHRPYAPYKNILAKKAGQL